MPQLTEIASGLAFPEGPFALDDGSILVVEIAGERLTRIASDGRKQEIARLPGGPNGAAIGPDGACYICNNGGSFTYAEVDGLLFPGPTPPSHQGGSIDRVDLNTGKVETLYTKCGDIRLCGPNDIVFDQAGGFWFTDHGATRDHHRVRVVTGVFYAKADGSSIREAIFPLDSPNGLACRRMDQSFMWRKPSREGSGNSRWRDLARLHPPRRHGHRMAARYWPVLAASACSTASPSMARAT